MASKSRNSIRDGKDPLAGLQPIDCSNATIFRLASERAASITWVSCSSDMLPNPSRLATPFGRPARFFLRLTDLLLAFLVVFFRFLVPCVALMWRPRWPAIENDLSHFEHLNVFLGIGFPLESIKNHRYDPAEKR